MFFLPCRYMAIDKNYGDHILLKAMSLKFGTKTTVLKAPTLTEERFRHQDPLKGADFVLVYNGCQHYSGTGERERFVRKVICPIFCPTACYLYPTTHYFYPTMYYSCPTTYFSSAHGRRWKIPGL